MYYVKCVMEDISLKASILYLWKTVNLLFEEWVWFKEEQTKLYNIYKEDRFQEDS